MANIRMIAHIVRALIVMPKNHMSLFRFIQPESFDMKGNGRFHIVHGRFIGIALSHNHPFQAKRIGNVYVGIFFDKYFKLFHFLFMIHHICKFKL
jgi:hypothetical protein